MEIYAPQTKILEGATKDEIQIFDRLFNGSWPKLSTHAPDKWFENPDFIFCYSFQNLRLGGIKLPNHCFCCDRFVLSTFFIHVLLEAWKCDFFARHTGTEYSIWATSHWNVHRISSFVPPSKIFVWEPYRLRCGFLSFLRGRPRRRAISPRRSSSLLMKTHSRNQWVTNGACPLRCGRVSQILFTSGLIAACTLSCHDRSCWSPSSWQLVGHIIMLS